MTMVLRALPDDAFEVRASEVPELGHGLFARVAIAVDEIVLEYTGERMTREEMEARYPGDTTALYAICGTNDDGTEFYIDGADAARAGIARFVNHPPAGRAPNLRFGSGANRMWLVAVRDIASGEELYADYGHDYFKGENAPARR